MNDDTSNAIQRISVQLSRLTLFFNQGQGNFFWFNFGEAYKNLVFKFIFKDCKRKKTNNLFLQSYAKCLFFMVIKFGFSVIQIIVFLRIWRAPLTLYRKKTLQCINDKYQIKQNKKLLTTPKPNLNDWNIPILMKPNTKLFLHFAMYFLSNSSPCYK